MKILGSLVCMSLFGFVLGCSDEPGAPVGGGGESAADGGAGGGNETVGGSAEGGAGGAGSTPSPTTVTVRGTDGLLKPSVDVIVNDADGVLEGQALTGDDGTAEVLVPAGGSVTIAYAFSYDAPSPWTSRHVATMAFAGLAPDAVTFNAEVPVAAAIEPNMNMTQQFSYPPRAGAASYEIVTNCGSKETTSQSMLLNVPDCTQSGLFDAVLVARDAIGDIIDSAQLADQPFAGEFASLPMSWSGIGGVPIAFEVSNIPAGSLLWAYSSATGYQAKAALSVYASTSFDDASEDALLTLRHLAAYGSEHCQSLRLQSPGPDPLIVERALRRCGSPVDTSDFALDAARLARFDPEMPSFDPVALSWTAGPSGDVGDLLIVEQRWERGDDIGSWSIYVEPAAATFAFPTLPPRLDAFIPDGGDTIGNISASHVDYPEGGFADAVAAGVPSLHTASLEQVTSLLPD